MKDWILSAVVMAGVVIITAFVVGKVNFLNFNREPQA